MFPVMAFCGRDMERSHILDVLKLPNQDSASNWDIDGGLWGEVKICCYDGQLGPPVCNDEDHRRALLDAKSLVEARVFNQLG